MPIRPSYEPQCIPRGHEMSPDEFLAERLISARPRAWLGHGSGLRDWRLSVMAGVASTGPVYTWYALRERLLPPPETE